MPYNSLIIDIIIFVMSKYKNIFLNESDSISVLTFNRPQSLNAMNREMMDEIIDALKKITADRNIRVAVITGTGRAFMAGADIMEYAVQTHEEFESFQQRGKELYSLIEQSDIPFIAAVNGLALGGGFEIALACDLIISTSSAKMGLPEVHLGLIPGGGGSQRLLQKIGMNRLKEMLLLGEMYSSQQMFDWGVVNLVADENNFTEAWMRIGNKLKRRPAQSLKVIKEMLEPSSIEKPFEERLFKEGISVSQLFYTQVSQNLIQSFVNKNK
jgi:enoyl-CoA hydratase/carnithine racemase